MQPSSILSSGKNMKTSTTKTQRCLSDKLYSCFRNKETNLNTRKFRLFPMTPILGKQSFSAGSKSRRCVIALRCATFQRYEWLEDCTEHNQENLANINSPINSCMFGDKSKGNFNCFLITGCTKYSPCRNAPTPDLFFLKYCKNL